MSFSKSMLSELAKDTIQNSFVKEKFYSFGIGKMYELQKKKRLYHI